MKKKGIIKRNIVICTIFLMSIYSFAAIVSDNDGAAFITKAEFDSLKNDFQSQIDNYNQSIDSKIDGAIASYLAGIKISKEETLKTIFDYIDSNTSDNFKRIRIIGKNNESWFTPGWTSGHYGQKKLMPMIETYMNVDLTWYSPYWRGSGSTKQHSRIDNKYDMTVRFQRANSSFYNISMWGQGNAIDEMAYGLRGMLQYNYSYFYYITTTGGNNWCAMSPIKVNSHWKFNNYNITSNADDQSSVNLLTSMPDNINNWGADNVMHLRWGKTSSAATPRQLVEPVLNQDGVLWQDAGTSTTNGWTQYQFQGNCYAGALVYRYTWYTMNGTPSTNYKSSMYYFFPNADDDNQLFKYDSVDIAGNYKKITVPEDDEIVWTGTTNDDGKGWKVTGWLSKWYPSYESGVLYKTIGSPSNAIEHSLPTVFNGTINTFNEDRLTKVTDCYWSRLTGVSGTQQKIGDAPILFGHLSNNGTVTIKGMAFNNNNANSEWGKRNGGSILVGFSKKGRSDEVLNTSTNQWEIKNCIPFKYRKVGTTAWTDATGPVTWTMSNQLYEFQFPVEKNQDYYVHAVDPSNATNGRDEQGVHFYVDTTAYDATFVPEE